MTQGAQGLQLRALLVLLQLGFREGARSSGARAEHRDPPPTFALG